MLVFRKSVTAVPAASFRSELTARLQRHATSPDRETVLPLLLRAGELETALEDEAGEAETPSTGGRGALAASRAFTDAVADVFVRRAAPAWQLAPSWMAWAAGVALPTTLRLRRPEGYAYYALDPGTYAARAHNLPLANAHVTVLGVRSIGTSLSAVVAAVLRQRGCEVRRATVRPRGHPWDRQVRATDAALPAPYGRAGPTIIVDEGPGLSGSTLLATAEATEAAGTPAHEITIMCSRTPDPQHLLARDAARRWQRFRVLAVERNAVDTGELDLSAGRWRALTHGGRQSWPAIWKETERAKRLALERGELSKFVGFSPYGERAAETAALLADAGLSPPVVGFGGGFLRFRWCEGRCLSNADRVPLPQLVEYLAFRAAHCRAPAAAVAGSELRDMLETNVAEATGRSVPRGLKLELTAPVFCDGRLLPHEWVRAHDGRLLKTDGCDHGDDHLFPGPCDTAWDVAGAVVEWNLDAATTGELLRAYAARTKDQVGPRLPPYLLAYAAFRAGCMRLARLSADPSEGRRLRRLQRHYLRIIKQQFIAGGAEPFQGSEDDA